eukprot:1068851-Prorocentrum_lima.AAC.1
MRLLTGMGRRWLSRSSERGSRRWTRRLNRASGRYTAVPFFGSARSTSSRMTTCSREAGTRGLPTS